MPSLRLSVMRPGVALLLAAGLPAVAFQPGQVSILGQDQLQRPVGLASFDDSSCLVLDAGQVCRSCSSPRERARCTHAKPARLLSLSRAASGGWSANPVSDCLPADCQWLLAGPGHTLLVPTPRELLRLFLIRQGSGWRLHRSETVLDWVRMVERLGPEAAAIQSLAVAPNGSLAVGFARSAVLLPATGLKTGSAPIQWLLGKQPESAGGMASAPFNLAGGVLGMVVAFDEQGLVHILDRSSGAVYRVDPAPDRAGRLAKTLEITGKAWPAPAFLADDLVANRGQLYLAGRVDPDPGSQPVLFALTAAVPGQPQTVAELKLDLEPVPWLAFTPGGHLFLLDSRSRRVRFIENSEAKAVADLSAATRATAEAATTAAYAGVPGAGAGSSPAAAPDRPGPEPAGTAGVDCEPWPADAAPGLRPLEPKQRQEVARATAALASGALFEWAYSAWLTRLGPPGSVWAPKDQGSFSLEEDVLRRALRWMLLHAGEANQPGEVREWRVERKGTTPIHAFGLYRRQGEAGVSLEILDLTRFAEAMDGLPGGEGSVAAALAASDGRTGIRGEGPARFCHGLTVELGADHLSFAAIRPGGLHSAGEATESRSR